MSVRAAIYARCSTEEESQKDALVKQAAEARECVEKKGWILVDSYIESKSGTSTKGRSQYNRLYHDLCKNKFDIIVIKSQDRLMRNTKDWYLFVDRLTAASKRLYIYIEQKFYTADDALITGIKAILAEDYSRELSKKINNAHYNRQKNGGAVLLTNNTYGYRKLPDKSVAIVEEEARIKRHMYELCAAGYGSRIIAKILKEEGVLNRKGNPFSDGDIRRMIRNPINKGTVVMHRVHFDFDSKKYLKIPEEEQFVYDNKIPAIVSSELWQLANDAITRRAEIYNGKKGYRYKDNPGGANSGRTNLHSINPGRTNFSGKIVCGICGAAFYRTTRQISKHSVRRYEWKCSTYLQEGKSGCSNIHIGEEKLYEILENRYIQDTCDDSHRIIGKIMGFVKKVLDEESLQQEIDRCRQQQEEIEAKMNALLSKLLDGVISDNLYKMKQDELEKTLKITQDKIKSLKKKEEEVIMQDIRMTEIEKYLKEGGLHKAVTAKMLENTAKIMIYPNYLELISYIENKEDRCGLALDAGESGDRIRLDFGNVFNYQEQKREEREAVVELIRENPKITVREAAQILNITLSTANYRMKVLKREGRIRFKGAGGKGIWEVLE